jgi:hypothetical protein
MHHTAWIIVEKTFLIALEILQRIYCIVIAVNIVVDARDPQPHCKFDMSASDHTDVFALARIPKRPF